jgi:hypothetical protein
MGDAPTPEMQAVARALHAARIEVLPTQVERDLAYMVGNFREDYEMAPHFLAALNELGWLLLYNLLTPREHSDGE